MTASKPPLAERLVGLRQCGCTDLEPCPQHIEAMTREERREYRRGARGANRGRTTQPEQTP